MLRRGPKHEWSAFEWWLEWVRVGFSRSIDQEAWWNAQIQMVKAFKRDMRYLWRWFMRLFR